MLLKNYKLAIIMAYVGGSTNSSEYLVMARMIMDYMDPQGDIIGDFIKNVGFDASFEEIDELKNYDAALAMASAGRIDEACTVMESIDPKKELAIEDFKQMEAKLEFKLSDIIEKYRKK